MGRGSSRLRYRSWVRLAFWTPLGLFFAVGGVGRVGGGDLGAAVFAGLGLAVLAFAWWPCLLITRDGVVIRNFTSTRLAWRDVADIRVKPELSYLGVGSSRIDAFAQFARETGLGQGVGADPGLIINTHSRGPIPVFAVQRRTIFSRPRFAERVARELAVARQAVATHRDPVEAVRTLRAARRGADGAAASGP